MKRKGYAKQRKRDGKWGFDLYLTDPSTGLKTRRLRLYEWESRADAEKVAIRLVQADQDARFGIAPPRPAPGLRDVLERQVEQMPPGPLRTMTRRVIATWLDLLPGGLRVTDVTTAHLRLYVDHRQPAIAASSVNRELGILSAHLRTARRQLPELAQWLLPATPWLKVRSSRRERIVTDEEYRRILAWLRRPPDAADGSRAQLRRNAHRARLRIAAIFDFAIQTGLRPIEIYRLEWTDIDFGAEIIKVDTSKTDKTRYLPLTAAAREILREREAIRRPGDRYIFSERGTRAPKAYRILRRACEACGIEYGRGTRNGLELYCSRHTFTTRLVQAGVDVRLVGDATGQSDQMMVLHYTHMNPDSQARIRAAMEAIQRRREGRDTAEITASELRAWLLVQIEIGEGVVVPPRWLGALREVIEGQG